MGLEVDLVWALATETFMMVAMATEVGLDWDTEGALD